METLAVFWMLMSVCLFSLLLMMIWCIGEIGGKNLTVAREKRMSAYTVVHVISGMMVMAILFFGSGW